MSLLKLMHFSLGSKTKMVAQNPSIGIMYRVYGVYQPCILPHKNLCGHCSIDIECCVFFF